MAAGLVSHPPVCSFPPTTVAPCGGVTAQPPTGSSLASSRWSLEWRSLSWEFCHFYIILQYQRVQERALKQAGRHKRELAWSSEIDGRPDWPSDHMPAPRPDVWFECSSLSTHCSKVRGSTSVGTGFAHSFTRPSVRGRRRSHPTRSGHLGAERRKVTWFRVFQNTPGAIYQRQCRPECNLIEFFKWPTLVCLETGNPG